MESAFHAYDAACARVAGSLTGLPSVSITMRDDFILGRDAPCAVRRSPSAPSRRS